MTPTEICEHVGAEGLDALDRLTERRLFVLLSAAIEAYGPHCRAELFFGVTQLRVFILRGDEIMSETKLGFDETNDPKKYGVIVACRLTTLQMQLGVTRSKERIAKVLSGEVAPTR